MQKVRIHYHRPPDRCDIFVQDLVVDTAEHKITLHEHTPVTSDLKIGDQVIYEPGAPIVWFVFPGRWYDLGRFHLRDSTFTGYYVNLITPVEIDGNTWTMYDLCLDLWVFPENTPHVLDQDEFDEAVDHHWIDQATAGRARRELDALLEDVSAGRWPPSPVADFGLQRIRTLHSEGR